MKWKTTKEVFCNINWFINRIGNSKKLKKTTLLEVEPSKKLIRDHIDKIDWKVISDQMKSRNAEECLIRYINYEDPYINK